MMNKALFLTKILLLSLCFGSNLFGQTILIDPTTSGAFEGASFAADGWTVLNNATAGASWVQSTGATAGFSGAQCAYITSNTAGTPPPHTYTNSFTSRVSALYRDVTIPAGESQISLSFNWICVGETGYDRLQVWAVPTTFTPLYGTASMTTTGSAPTGRVQLGTGANGYVGSNSWTTANITIPAAYAGTSFRLVFQWRNDTSGGSNPPIAIDNVSLISSCTSALTAAATSITSASATMNAVTFSGATGYNFRYREVGSTTWINASGNPYATISAPLTGLSANTNYEYQVSAVGPVCNAWSPSRLFYTGHCVPSGSTVYYLTNVVTTGGATNFSNPTTTGGYNNYSSTISCSNFIGAPTTISLTPSIGTNFFYCWIDWNNDFDFADANETIFATSLYTSSHTGTINIPAGTPNGSYRMRVANSWSGGITSCGPAPNGEYEDYTFNVVTAPSCLPPSGLSANVLSTSSATLAWSAVAGATSYNLEYRIVGAPSWTSFPSNPISGLNATVTGLSVANYEWRVQATCGGDLSSFSTGTFSTEPGRTCALPIVVNSYPYTDNNTTCGKGNFYGIQCGGSYGGGEETVYELQITTLGTYQFIVSGPTTWTGWFLKNSTSCTVGGGCLTNAVSGSGTTATGTFNFTTAGTYYLIIDHFPAPNCGSYTLQINAPSPPPACVASQTATPDVCSNYDVVLSWPASPTASGYRITMGTTPGGTQVANNVDLGNVLTINLTNPSLSTTYYWTVVPYNLGGPATGCIEYSFTTGSNGCLCVPTYTFGKEYGDLISNVTILGTTLSNNTGTAEVNPAYTFFNTLPNHTANLQAGTSYTVQVSVGSYGNQNMAAWIDFNDDGVFQATERIGFTTTDIPANGTANFTISLPCNPPVGVRRLRIRDVFNVAGNTIDPCLNYGYGETEDYNVTILPPPPCPSISGLASSAITFNSATINWNVGCTETQWNVHVSTSATPPSGTPSNPGVTATTLPLTGLLGNTLYYVHVRPVCGVGNLGSWTTISFTTPLAPPLNDGICGAKEIKSNAGATTSLNTYGFFSGMTCFNQIDNNAAATATGANEASCGGANGKSVWYKFTTPACAVGGVVPFQIEFTTDNAGTTVDTKMALFSSSDGTCTGTMTQIACNDDAVSTITTCGGTATNRSVILNSSLAPNTTYYIVVDEFGGNDNGFYEVSGRALIPPHTATVSGSNVLNLTTANRGAALNTYYVRLQGTTGHTITNSTGLTYSQQVVNGNTYLSQILYRCVNTSNQFYYTPVVTTSVPANPACNPITALNCSNSGSTYTLTWPAISGLYTGVSGELSGYILYYRVIGTTGYFLNSNPTVSCSGGICTLDIPNLTNPAGYEFWLRTRCSATATVQSNIATCDGGKPMSGGDSGETYTFTNSSKETQYVDVKLSDDWNNFGLEIEDNSDYYIYINEQEEIVAQKMNKANDGDEMFDFELIPNPTSIATTIVVTGNPSNASYVIYDTQGRLTTKGYLSGLSTTIDGSSWSSGVYLVTVQSGSKQQTKRLVISK